jgi:hypothetical protein
MDLSNQPLISGFPEQWNNFAERHREFLNRFPHLMESLDLAFMKTIMPQSKIDLFMFAYGRFCSESFFEILLMCQNGYGYGAFKLLRSFYEQVVTLLYIQKNPDDLDNFYDYYYIFKHKQLGELIECDGEKVVREKGVDVDLVNKLYENVREKFMITSCNKCSRKRLNHTWSKLDMVSMSKKCGIDCHMIPHVYYHCLAQAHASAESLLDRIKWEPGKGLSFDGEAQTEESDKALRSAHRLILHVLQAQQEHFNTQDLDEKIKVCYQDFAQIWKNHKTK